MEKGGSFKNFGFIYIYIYIDNNNNNNNNNNNIQIIDKFEYSNFKKI